MLDRNMLKTKAFLIKMFYNGIENQMRFVDVLNTANQLNDFA